MKFGQVNVPDSLLWIAGLVLPVVGLITYRHFHADPTDIITDIEIERPSGNLVFTYNSGPDDVFALSELPRLPFSESQTIFALKAALIGVTRDRLRSSLQQTLNLVAR